jgi:hypothetical protein
MAEKKRRKSAEPAEKKAAVVPHPLAAKLADRTFVGPGGLVAFEKATMESVEVELIALAGKGPGFFQAYRHLMNLAFGLGERFPNSPAGMVLLQMLDRVSAAAMPKLGEADLQASHEMLEKVGNKFKEFTDRAEGDKLPDSGQRHKPQRHFKG